MMRICRYLSRFRYGYDFTLSQDVWNVVVGYCIVEDVDEGLIGNQPKVSSE